MIVERVLVLAYLAGCIGIGIFASRRVLGSRDEYWVAGRRIGTFVNAMAIMASLASGGSIIGVMGLAYSRGIPATLALFAGAVVGIPREYGGVRVVHGGAHDCLTRSRALRFSA